MHPTPFSFVCYHFPRPFAPLLPPSACTQVPFNPWGVRPSWGPPPLLFLRLSLPVSFSFYQHLLVFCFSAGWPFSGKNESPRRIHSMEVARLGPPPPDTWPCRRRSIYPPLPHLSSLLPSPRVVLIPSRWLKFFGCFDISSHYVRIL